MRFCALAFCCFFSVSAAAEEIRLLPSEFELSDSRLGQRLILERVRDGQFVGQVAGAIEFTSSDPAVVVIEKGMAKAVGPGKATITARSNGQSAVSHVVVRPFDPEATWSFRNHVQSVLSKTGCNMGACHGAAAGKNGFKLSLRGYDVEFDYFAITRHSRGRRIVPDNPGRSLLLTKPTGAIPHKGGLRFGEDSQEYRVVSEWIAAGQPGPSENDARLKRLEVLPDAAIVTPGQTQQFLVRAHFSDGRVEDVTPWAKFSSSNLTVAEVDADGKTKVTGHGEAAIVAWYLSTNAVATLTSPHPGKTADGTFANAERANVIDELVLRKLKDLNLPPSPRCSDGEFLRRATLDTTGVLPTVEETKSFLADNAPDKRDRLVDQLLTRPEYVDYWTYQWSDLLLVSGARLRPKAVESYSAWIREQVKNNTPWSQFARDVVTARGSTFENGAANFFSLHQDPLDMAETVTMAFLGTSINCARCHDHPLEKWTNDDYYAMANLFSRVRGKGWGGDFRNGDGLRTIFTVESGELIQPRTGRPQPPRPLEGEAIALEAASDRRLVVADWLTSSKNLAFRRAIANRVWANFFGIGIVEAVDDMRLTNPPSNEPLLAALSETLLQNGDDLKSLMRLILTSETYQRSSQIVGGKGTPGETASNAADERNFSRCFPRRLKAEVLLDAISAVVEAPTTFKDYPAGTRALQLRDVSVENYFLRSFGRPERILTCECERSNEPSMVQVLHLMNGETLNAKLTAKGNRIDRLIEAGTSNADLIDEAYLAALSRLPTETEKRETINILATTPADQKRSAVEDLYWSLLTSREFLFHH